MFDFSRILTQAAPVQRSNRQPGRRSSADHLAAFAGEVADKTVGSVMRTGAIVGQGLQNIPTRIGEALDPNDAESRGDMLANQASIHYGFTPSFKKQVHSANPLYLQGDVSKTKQSALSDGVAPTGLRYGDNRLHRIEVGKPGSKDADQVLMHEGLHDVYGSLKPETKVLYDSLINQAMNKDKDVLGPKEQLTPTSYRRKIEPGLRTWLETRLGNYKAAEGQKYNDISRLDPSVRNEVHSYVPEYYETTKRQMPAYLKDYYANYYNTGGRPTQIERVSPLRQMINRILGEE